MCATAARELYEENSNAFIALFKDLDEEMGKFDDVGEWLDALRDGNDGDPNCGIPLQSILSTSAALVRMHVVALQDPTLMLTVSEELLQRVLLLLQAIVLSKFCPADSDQSPPSAKRLHEVQSAKSEDSFPRFPSNAIASAMPSVFTMAWPLLTSPSLCPADS